jgi:putative ABC transport system permease protein
MRALRLLRDRVRGLFRREAVLRDIDEEMRSHLELAADEERRRGRSAEEARAAAAQRFGSVAAARDAAYDVRGGGGLEAVWHDLRFAARTLRRNPTVALSALLTWALGIGATVAVFSVVHPVLLRGLPFAHADRLVSVRETKLPELPSFSVSAGNFLAWREAARALDLLVAVQTRAPTVTGGGEPEQLRALAVSAGFFELYGVAPQLGRGLLPDEDAPGRDAVVVLSHGFWQRRFAGDPGVPGRQVVLDDRAHTVVGVMPAGLHPHMGDVDVWMPIAFTAAQRQNHGGHYLRVVGRLAPGATRAAALAELNHVAERLEKEHPEDNRGWRVTIVPLAEHLHGGVRSTLLLLAAAVVFVLLVAAANVASLLLGRAAAREREIAIRAALGAGRRRILRQLACESLLLSLIGGAAGMLVAVAGVDALLALAPRALGGLGEVKVDATLLAFTLAASSAVGLLVALIPGRQAARGDLASALRGGAGGSIAAGRARARRLLVTVEVAACLLLLVGGGLVMRSLVRLLDQDPGFRAGGVLVAQLNLPRSRYAEPERRVELARRLLAEVATLPGVEAAALTQSLPFVNDFVASVAVDGRPPDPGGQEPNANHYAVTADYFRALGIPLLAGRGLDERDAGVVLVNRKLARTFFPDGDAIGARLRLYGERVREIVGVVGDVKQYGLGDDATFQVYEPLYQQTFARLGLVVRGGGDPSALTGAIRARLAGIDGRLPLGTPLSLDDAVAASVAHRRFAVALLGIFAAVALALAVVGIYGVIADAVVQRTREIGVRVALGATPRDVLASMMGVGVVPAACGIVLGLAVAAAGVRLLGSLLYGVSQLDPVTWIAAPAIVAAVALVASWLPARRATRVDPMVALRFD